MFAVSKSQSPSCVTGNKRPTRRPTCAPSVFFRIFWGAHVGMRGPYAVTWRACRRFLYRRRASVRFRRRPLRGAGAADQLDATGGQDGGDDATDGEGGGKLHPQHHQRRTALLQRTIRMVRPSPPHAPSATPFFKTLVLAVLVEKSNSNVKM